MSISRVTLWMAVLAACSTGVQAEQMLRDHVQHSADVRQALPISQVFKLTAQPADDEPATYLVQALAAALPRANAMAGTSRPSGRWSATHSADLAPGQAETDTLIEALSALGPFGVSVADYLALNLPGLDSRSTATSTAISTTSTTISTTTGPSINTTGTRPPSLEGAKARSAPAAAPAMTLVAHTISVIATPAPAAGPTTPGGLSPALSEALTRYLLAAATLAILAGVGLRWLMSARRKGSPSLARP